MALRDYLLTRLATQQNARQLALELERAKAARQAASQAATTNYLQQLLGAGTQLATQVPGAIGKMGEAEGEALISEAITGLTPGEYAGEEMPVVKPADVVAQLKPEVLTKEQAITEPQPLEKLGVKPILPLPQGVGIKPGGFIYEEPAPQKTKVIPKVSGEFIPGSVKLIEEPNLSADFKKQIKKIIEKPLAGEELSRDIQTSLTGVPETRTIPVPGMGGLSVPTPEPKQVPAAQVDKTPSEKEIEPQLKNLKAIGEEEDPLTKAQQAFIKKINSWKPPKYKESTEELADKVIADVRKNQPEGNPILNILSFGQYSRKIEQSERLAKKLVIAEINKMRKQEAVDLRKQFIETAKLEAEQIALTQKDINDKRKAQLKVSMTSMAPEKAIERLQGFQDADNILNDVIQSGRSLINSGNKFPGGAKNAIEIAKTMAKSSTPLQKTQVANLNASLAAVGAGGNITYGPAVTKEQVLQQAIENIQNANMSDEAKEFTRKMIGAVQVLGKAREGGRMTDADLKFYLDNLVIQDAAKPSAMLGSINYLKQVNARTQNSWNNIYNTLYGDMYAQMFPNLTGQGFTPEELAMADKLGFIELPPEVKAALERVGGGTPTMGEQFGQVGRGAVEAAKSAGSSLTGTAPPPVVTGRP